MRLPPERVRIATWNCFGVPHSLADFAAGRPFWPERLVSSEVVRALSEFDVVCIQENLVDGVRESLERVKEAAGFAHLWFDPMGPDGPSGTFVGAGLALLSRLPLREVRFSRLPRGAGPDGWARKGFALADVVLPSGRVIHVVNTHLQADDANVPGDACRDARAAQLAELAGAVMELCKGGSPAILCGDMNVAHGTDEYERVRAALGDELVELASRAGLATYDTSKNDVAATFHSGGPERALIDYIWVSPKAFEAVDVRTILDQPLVDLGAPPAEYDRRPFASDHFGVGAVLELVG
jgi:endonuclease/exonuclease/phosphatase family metal-dependent hydrolase